MLNPRYNNHTLCLQAILTKGATVLSVWYFPFTLKALAEVDFHESLPLNEKM